MDALPSGKALRSRWMQAGAWAAAAAACMAIGAACSLHLGQDANWDLRNYHLYDAWSFLGGRLHLDHHPAGEQSFLNPLLDVLLYPLFAAMPDRWGGAILGGLQGLAAFAILVLGWMIFGANRRAIDIAVLAAAVGGSSAMVTSEYGTSFGDLTTAVLVLASLCFAVRACTHPDDSRLAQRLAWAGALMGAATALKLTNVIFGLGLLAAVMAFPPGRRLRCLAWTAVPAAMALIALQGWWSWILVDGFGNPVFPFANEVFRSPLYRDSNFKAPIFQPVAFFEVLFYPFYFPFNNRTAEVGFRDFRLAAAFVAAIVLAAALLGLRRRPVPPPPGAPHLRATAFLLVFGTSSYLAWMPLFSIQRYAIALDLLAPLAVFSALGFVARPDWRDALAVAVSAFLAATTVPADWGRVPWDGNAYSAAWNLDPAMRGQAVMMATPPLAFVAPTSGFEDTLWAGVPFSPPDRQAFLRKVGDRRLYILALDESRSVDTTRAAMRRIGVQIVAPCSRAWAKLAGAVLLCPVSKPGVEASLGRYSNDSAQWSFAIEATTKVLQLAPGEAAWLPVRLRNASSTPVWANLPDTYRLARLALPPEAVGEVNLSYHLHGAGGEMVLHEGARTPLPRSLDPGQEMDAHIRVVAPARPGRYSLRLDLVREGVEWMGPRMRGEPVSLEVRDPSHP